MQHDVTKTDAVIEGRPGHAHRAAHIKVDAGAHELQPIAGCDDFGKYHGCRFKRFDFIFTIGALGAVLHDENAHRAACAQHIVETIRGVAGAAVGLGSTAELSPQDAEGRILEGVSRMVQFLVAAPEAGDFVQFVLRELSSPEGAIDTLYNGVFEPVHRRLCQLWGQASGDPAESEHTRLAVFAMIGQVVYFRIGREAVLRRMDWSGYGPDEAATLTAIFTENVRAALAARRQGRK